MRILGFAVVACLLDIASGQPATLTLRAKLRDFKDYRPADTTTHPDFENDGYMECGGDGLGYVRNTIGADEPGDTTLFRGDGRGPVLQRLAHPTTLKPCFTGLDRFKDWYNDHPAVNRSFYTDLVLTRNTRGEYVFDDDNFLPLNPGAGFMKFRPTDPDPFGPRPDITPNDVWGFTMELHTTFTYVAGRGQVFSFKGDDDVWVFINDRLVIDLGGLHSSLTATVDLDARAAALGLVDGTSYPLDFFFAERHSTGSHCRITTSLQLIQEPALPPPVATPPGQVFRGSIQVGLAVPGQPDAQIRYSTDGSEPTEASPLYSAGLTFTATTTLKAKAYKAGFGPSSTLTETYALEPPAPQPLPVPVATPPGQAFRGSIRVGLSVPGHPDAQIRYTVDGSDPTGASPLYSGELTFTATTMLKARAYKTGYLASPALAETYVLEVRTLPTPVATPPGQPFQSSLQVSLAVPGHPEAGIRYTLDGSDPVPTSPMYTGPITLTSGTTVKARAYLAGWQPSGAMVETYTLVIPPNNISLKMDSAIHRSDGLVLVPGPEDLRQPIAIVSRGPGNPRCLACTPNLRDLVLQPGRFPEWTVVSRDPFRYTAQIYDHLGQFVAAQEGRVTREMLDQAPGDTAGYRELSFRWIPAGPDGTPVGTGAYILRTKVLSDPPSAAPARYVPTEAALFRTFGYLRRD